jgi:hypothetical protein
MTPGAFSLDFVRLDIHAGGRYALLVLPLSYKDLRGRIHTAHEGMPTDGLSIPRFFWRSAGAPMRHPCLRAAVIHDHYCFKSRSLPPGPDRAALRAAADRLFREMCKACGAGAAMAGIYYAAVRVGAWGSRNAPVMADYIREPALHLSQFRLESRALKG